MSKSKRRKNKNKTKGGSLKKRSLDRLEAGLPAGVRELPEISYSEIGLPKMSETLIEFAEPYLDYDHGLDSFRSSVSLAAMVWNLGLFPPSERTKHIEFLETTLGQALNGTDRVVLHTMIHEMLLRKDMLFAKDKRMIAGYDVVETKDDYHVNVASVLTAPPGTDD